MSDIYNLSAIWTSFTSANDTCSDSETSQCDELAALLKINTSDVHALMVKRSILNFHQWQIDFIRKAMLNSSNNILLCVCTSAGKTLAAELLCWHTLLFSKKDVIFIFPFVSIVQEKVESLVELSNELDFCLEEYAAGRGTIPPKKRTKRPSLFICTLEKADLLLDCLIIEGLLAERIGLIVSDEVHMICESGGRGARLECLLSKFCLCQNKYSAMRLLAMSATVSNHEELCQFLNNADLFEYNFRPTELEEYVKISREVFKLDVNNELRYYRSIGNNYTDDMIKNDPEYLMCLVSECIPRDSCVIFASTKRQCESLAKMIAELMPSDLSSFREEERNSLLSSLAAQHNGHICSTLSQTIPYGVAFHHGGLTIEERKTVEQAFQSKILFVLIATTTLAAGVNLPARRVIIRSPYSGRHAISHAQYKQMAGRAGRTGLCTGNGQSFLLLQDKRAYDNIFSAASNQRLVCRSQLNHQQNDTTDSPLKSYILSLISLQLVDDIRECVHKHSLYGLQNDFADIEGQIYDYLNQLERSKLINSCENGFQVTLLGSAICKARLSAEFGHLLLMEIDSVIKNIGLQSALHLICLSTPYDTNLSYTPSPSLMYSRYCELNNDDKSVCDRVIFSAYSSLSYSSSRSVEQLLVNAISGRPFRDDAIILKLRRLYLSLALYSLWQGNSFWIVSDKFQLDRGFLQSFSQLASSFAFSILRFCECYSERYWSICVLLPNFIKRLTHCVKPELIELMELPGVRKARACQLYNNGYTNVILIAKASPADMCKKIDRLSRRQARQIIEGSKLILRSRMHEIELEMNEIAGSLDGAV
ncbi:hypothetical protein GJ496_001339 [Pomphorhynchus laevis]|nr:hypothetical protein GJ496_001339 [Pomphorhynchus laevis]